MMTLMATIFEAYHLKLNIKKTKTMKISNQEQDHLPSLVHVRNLQVENVSSFKFLGATITHNPMHSNMNEIRLKIVLARSKFHKYRHLLNNKNIYLKTRLILFNAFVRSVLTYSIETLTLTALQMQKLESAYLRLLRSMVKDGFKTKTP